MENLDYGGGPEIGRRRPGAQGPDDFLIPSYFDCLDWRVREVELVRPLIEPIVYDCVSIGQSSGKLEVGDPVARRI